MELIHIILTIAIGTLVTYILLKWTEIWHGRLKELPPGTMGWPLLGENASFLKHGLDFFKNRRIRYGDVFKTNILGVPTVVCMDPNITKYILTHEGEGFAVGYPQSMLDIVGEQSLSNLSGAEHKALRGVLMPMISAPAMRDKLLPKINEFMQSYLANWSGRVLDLQDKSHEIVMLLTLKMIAGIEESNSFTNELKKELYHLAHGCSSLRINLPGTPYYKALQAKSKIVRMLEEMIDERRESTCHKHDILDTLLMGEDGNNTIKLSREQIIDFLIMFVLSGYETVSVMMKMAVKYLHDHPNVQEELRRENLEIRKGKHEDYMINWNDYKSMVFTRAVILETIRLQSAATGYTTRKTTMDTRIKGHVIPKGWRIFLYIGEISSYPDICPEPLKFNPSRWLESNLESHQYFMLFGSGVRLCAGKELAILEISLYLHYLVTRYRWEEVSENKTVNIPKKDAANGFCFRFSVL